MAKPLSTAAVAALNRVLLQCATRAERRNADKAADELAREIAKQCDEYARAG